MILNAFPNVDEYVQKENLKNPTSSLDILVGFCHTLCKLLHTTDQNFVGRCTLDL